MLQGFEDLRLDLSLERTAWAKRDRIGKQVMIQDSAGEGDDQKGSEDKDSVREVDMMGIPGTRIR